MHVSLQEDLGRACADVVAVVAEHRGNGEDGFDGALRRLLGVDESSAVEIAEFIAAEVPPGLAFLVGMLVGVQLEPGAEAV